MYFQDAKTLPAVFIDTFYDAKSTEEASKFKQYTDQLMKKANEVEPFHCKDIKTALTELMAAQKELENIQNELEQVQDELDQAKGNYVF